MENWNVSSSSGLIFHLVGWKKGPHLGSHILGESTAVEPRPAVPQFLNFSSPQKSLHSLGVYMLPDSLQLIYEAPFSLSKQELWSQVAPKFPSSLGLHVSGALEQPFDGEGVPGTLLHCSTKKYEIQHILKCLLEEQIGFGIIFLTSWRNIKGRSWNEKLVVYYIPEYFDEMVVLNVIPNYLWARLNIWLQGLHVNVNDTGATVSVIFLI